MMLIWLCCHEPNILSYNNMDAKPPSAHWAGPTFTFHSLNNIWLKNNLSFTVNPSLWLVTLCLHTVVLLLVKDLNGGSWCIFVHLGPEEISHFFFLGHELKEFRNPCSSSSPPFVTDMYNTVYRTTLWPHNTLFFWRLSTIFLQHHLTFYRKIATGSFLSC